MTAKRKSVISYIGNGRLKERCGEMAVFGGRHFGWCVEMAIFGGRHFDWRAEMAAQEAAIFIVT